MWSCSEQARHGLHLVDAVAATVRSRAAGHGVSHRGAVASRPRHTLQPPGTR